MDRPQRGDRDDRRAIRVGDDPVMSGERAALISGTTSGTAGFMRKAEELSMTIAPARTAAARIPARCRCRPRTAPGRRRRSCPRSASRRRYRGRGRSASSRPSAARRAAATRRPENRARRECSAARRRPRRSRRQWRWRAAIGAGDGRHRVGRHARLRGWAGRTSAEMKKAPSVPGGALKVVMSPLLSAQSPPTPNRGRSSWSCA